MTFCSLCQIFCYLYIMENIIANQSFEERLEIALNRDHGGNQPIYSPREFGLHFIDYVNWVKRNPIMKPQLIQKSGDIVDIPIARPFTIKAFCLFAGISTSLYHKYRGQKSHKAVVDFVDMAIYTNKFEGATVGIFNAMIVARDLGIGDSVEHILNDRRKSVSELFPSEGELQEIKIEETTPEEVKRINDTIA